jgi:hypothetical protein
LRNRISERKIVMVKFGWNMFFNELLNLFIRQAKP